MCPSCDAESADSATFCSLCLKPFGHSGAGDSRKVDCQAQLVSDLVSRVRETEADVPAGVEVIATQDTWRIQRGPNQPWIEIESDEAARMLATPGAVVSDQVSTHSEYVLIGGVLLLADDVPGVVLADMDDAQTSIGLPPDCGTSGPVPVKAYRFTYRAVVDQAAKGSVDHEVGVVAFAAMMLPILESVDDREMIVVRRQPGERDALCVASSGEVLGYLP